MAQTGYSEGTSPRIVQIISLPQIAAGTSPELWKVPDGFFSRWRFISWTLTPNTADLSFRPWFIAVLGPSKEDFGRIIPGFATLGGGGAITQNPVHQFMDATLPVFFDEVFQGSAGEQPLWDYSGMGNLWYPAGVSFQFDATRLAAGDTVTGLHGMVELIEAETIGNLSRGGNLSANALAYFLHTP